MNQDERKAFVANHRTAMFGFGRKNDGPAMSIVYYVMDGDDILVSTMSERGKAKAIARNPKVSLAVLDEQWPPTYLLVYGDARLETEIESVTDVCFRIAGVMAGKAMPEDVRPAVRQGAIDEGRVVIRITPYGTFETPPRHVHSVDDLDGLTHWTSAVLPWT
jgi:PPOX class probable F420-dependent enzyme